MPNPFYDVPQMVRAQAPSLLDILRAWVQWRMSLEGPIPRSPEQVRPDTPFMAGSLGGLFGPRMVRFPVLGDWPQLQRPAKPVLQRYTQETVGSGGSQPAILHPDIRSALAQRLAPFRINAPLLAQQAGEPSSIMFAKDPHLIQARMGLIPGLGASPAQTETARMLSASMLRDVTTPTTDSKVILDLLRALTRY